MKDAPAAVPEQLISEARLLRLLDIPRRQGVLLHQSGAIQPALVCDRRRFYRPEQVKALAVQLGRAIPAI